jgi:hypothetical protein
MPESVLVARSPIRVKSFTSVTEPGVFTRPALGVRLERGAVVMANKTYHVVSAGGSHWAVKKAGTKPAVYSTQAEAIKAAGRLAKGKSEYQVVILKPDGRFVVKKIHGLPAVQNPPQKSSLGTMRISKAISAALQKRLETT